VWFRDLNDPGEHHFYDQAASRAIFCSYAAVVKADRRFRNSKAKADSARFPAPAHVHPVERIKKLG
jgi:hypothetical protein